MGQFSMGQAVLREEDPSLLRGEGCYTADMELPRNTLHASVLRSTHAHARIASIDTARALKSPGVVAVYTGADIAEDKLGTIVCRMPMKRADGSPMHQSGMFGLVRERVRMVGDLVEFVVAETQWQAKDAAELIEVAMHVSVKGVYSNTSTTATYRGAGRPEASYIIERIIDIAAQKLGRDPVAIRKLNAIPKIKKPGRPRSPLSTTAATLARTSRTPPSSPTIRASPRAAPNQPHAAYYAELVSRTPSNAPRRRCPRPPRSASIPAAHSHCSSAPRIRDRATTRCTRSCSRICWAWIRTTCACSKATPTSHLSASAPSARALR